MAIAGLVRGIRNPKILEIGGGLGRIAFYATTFGILDYTIVDIAVSSLAPGLFPRPHPGRKQRHARRRARGRLARESHGAGLPARRQAPLRLVINVDALTEIGRAPATEYWRAIREQAAIFLSINHEANEFTIGE